MRLKGHKYTLIGIAVAFLALSMLAADSLWSLEIFVYAMGFCQRVLPQVRIDYGVLAGGIILLIMTMALSHLTLAWLSRMMRGKQWPFRWTICCFVMLFVLFSVGLLAVGMMRDIRWLNSNGTDVHHYDTMWVNSPRWLANAASGHLQNGAMWVEAAIVHSESIEIIDLAGHDGTTQAVIAFPRDPARQARIGIAIARLGHVTELRPWQSPAAVIREITAHIAADQRATTRAGTRP